MGYTADDLDGVAGTGANTFTLTLALAVTVAVAVAVAEHGRPPLTALGRTGVAPGFRVPSAVLPDKGRAATAWVQARGRKDRRRRLLPTTKTEENAMAAPAIIGLSSPAAASGRAATL